MGNLFGAVAPSTITVTGVPPLENVSWTVTIVPGSQYGYGSQSNETPSSPTEFTASTTIYENFTEQVLVQILTNPLLGRVPHAGEPGVSRGLLEPADVLLHPLQLRRLPVRRVPVAPVRGHGPAERGPGNLCFSSGSCNIYTSWMNLSFQSWTGAGREHQLLPQPDLDHAARAGERDRELPGPGDLHEPEPGLPLPRLQPQRDPDVPRDRLPTGAEWNVSLANDQGQTVTVSGTTPTLTIASAATTGIVNYTIWAVPSSIPSEVWNGTASPVHRSSFRSIGS